MDQELGLVFPSYDRYEIISITSGSSGRSEWIDSESIIVTGHVILVTYILKQDHVIQEPVNTNETSTNSTDHTGNLNIDISTITANIIEVVSTNVAPHINATHVFDGLYIHTHFLFRVKK